MATQAKFNDTRCVGIIVEGTVGTVTITKANKKSFYFEGDVEVLNKNKTVKTTGKATFWKDSKDGLNSFFKSELGAVLTVKK